MLHDLHNRDLRHLWHPYSDVRAHDHAPAVCIARAEGAYLIDTEGRRYLDGIASWWAVSLGHSHPKIVEAIRRQAGELQHAILAGMSHAPAIELAERLAQLAPSSLNRVYFAADGSSVVEAAMKAAVQYWRNRGEPARTRFVGLEQGYHGDTLGAIGVGYVDAFHSAFADCIVPAFRIPSPYTPLDAPEAQAAQIHASAAALDELLARQAGTVAAVLLEPRIQAAAGMWIHPAAYLQQLRAVCDRHDVLLIADEIAVGLGRTGAMFACDTAGIVPDILCVGKGLTGGTLPMSAFIARDEIYAAFREGRDSAVFWDGHTFCGNPISAAAALAALEIMAEEDLPASQMACVARLAKGFSAIGEHAAVLCHRSVGFVGMCQLREEAGGASLAQRVCALSMERGLFVRPLGNVLYLWPPLTVSTEELGKMLEILAESLDAALRDIPASARV
jgi:adenosylmethionine-8-amino-7-oxononanoate aminotransferase